MKTDSEIKILGFEILSHYLGMIEAERFITLIQREKFDYTKWRESLFNGLRQYIRELIDLADQEAIDNVPEMWNKKYWICLINLGYY